MPVSACFLLFAALWLQAGFGYSQTIADSSQYRQAKLGIWCETTRFIYADNGADSLLKRLSCRNWNSLQASLQLNALGEKAFFDAIEKPAIYAGYTTYDARLAKLIDEISKKLKASPSRQARDPQLQGVDSLQRKLAAIAVNPQAFTKAVVPVQASQGMVVNEEEQSELRQQNNQNPAGVNEGALEEEASLPWLEIVQWMLLLLLAALLGWLFKRNTVLEKELNKRMAKRKQEIATLAVKKAKEPLPVAEASSAPVPPGMGEKEVLRLIRKELDRFRQQQQMKASRPPSPTNQQKPVPTKKEVVENREPVAAPVENKTETPAEAGIFFDKLPFKGGFHQNHLSRQPHPDSIYTIQVLQERPEEAAFWVTEDHDVQKYAMQNGLSFFEEACDYSQVEESPSRVRNLEKGMLRKKGHLWQIEKKAKVSFE
jgi:hypothetical protein